MTATGVDQERLTRILADLENISAAEGAPARVSIRCEARTYGLVANQTGFVHLATEMLRAATTTPPAMEHRDRLEPIVRREIRQVFTPDSTLAIDRIERSEDLHDGAVNGSAARRADPRFWNHFIKSFISSLLPALWLLLGGITTTVWAADTFVIPRYTVATGPVIPMAAFAEEAPADAAAPTPETPAPEGAPAQ